MRLKQLSLVVIGLAVLGGAANAADLRPVYKAPPPAPVLIYNWSGFYVGGHVGYGWADANITVIDGNPFNPPGTSSVVDTKGFLGGVQAGFNWQAGNWVFGVEGDYSWGKIDGSATLSSPTFPAFTNQAEREFDGIGTVTGRVGYAWNNFMLYGKGGWAWVSDYSQSATNFSPAGAIIGTSAGSTSANGWTLGAGFEYGFAPSWSFKVEYNYIDLETQRFTVLQNTGLTPQRDLDGDFHLLKVGLNYRFGGYSKTPVVAKY